MWGKDAASSLLSQILDLAYEYLVYTKYVTH